MEWDPYVADCPSRRLLDRIGDRWTVLIVVALDPGPQRFGALASRVGGISQKMLTQTLRSLERDGFVTRTAYPEIPPRVEYALTPLGRSLLKPLRALEEWAVANMPAVVQSHDVFAASARQG
ncbi:MAG: helix-turn-helix domain-containing protein [Propionibacteriaceae bacterium]|nr:helix-turn-helix transcriptional regulator [Micropruina sp.]HBX80598.1 transcriptional regulator [Propionibacteriaceae bacterium]HBY21798.1 transcriptional regulator [Propionibacteriaceae bacterium]